MSSQECPATEKVCKDCRKKKPLSDFYEKAKRVDGSLRYFAQCKACFGKRSAESYEKRRDAKLKRCAEYREENAERIKRYLRKWYKQNRKHVISRSKAYQSRPERKSADSKRQAKRYEDNREQIRAKQAARNATPEGKAKQRAMYRKHYTINKHLYVAKENLRRTRKLQATPVWVDPKDFRQIYKLARQMTLETGVVHVVDHIVPLVNKNVCGLHVPWNLQVIPQLDNSRKFNKLIG